MTDAKQGAMTVRLGKQPATTDHRDLKLSRYLTPALPKTPRAFGHETLVHNWGMLGNDTAGDCVFAGAAHETLLWTAEGGKPAAFNTPAVLSDYSAVTGYTPDDPSSDQGTNVRDAMKYRAKTGIIDAHGHRHKIGAYLALDPGNLGHLEAAMYLFGAVGVGIQFPSSAMDQFNDGKPWTPVKGATIEGGHYIPLVAMRSGYLECVTWGRVQKMSVAFAKEYIDEAWAIVSEEALHSGRSPEGLDLAGLKADLKVLA